MKKVTRAARPGGKRGIRTPGPVKINGFQDRRIRPLCHLSVCKGNNFFCFHQTFFILFCNIFIFNDKKISFTPLLYAMAVHLAT